MGHNLARGAELPNLGDVKDLSSARKVTNLAKENKCSTFSMNYRWLTNSEFPPLLRSRAFDSTWFYVGQRIERNSIIGQGIIVLKLVKECYGKQIIKESLSW